MKRLHIHVSVEDIAASTRFYSALFAADPTVRKIAYAQWLLEDPRLNFAISQRSAQTGIKHLGIQVEDRTELEEVYARLKRADRPVLEEGATTCCYARGEKSWIADPQGVQWETFLTTGASTVYGHDAVSPPCPTESVGSQQSTAGACCAPSCCAPNAA